MTLSEFDADTECVRATYDSDDSTSLAVVEVVATALGKDPIDLSPIHDSIDTDGLDDLFATTVDDYRRRGKASFRYEGFDVTVFSEGTIEVKPSTT